MALIYIVEDDENIREIEQFALKNVGHMAVGFECARDFYAKVKEIIPDLIILDIMLPDENGMDILKKIRTDKLTEKIPVIMVTAKTTEIDLIKGFDLGADDYIKKPFSVMEFIIRIKALLRRTSVTEERVFALDKLVLNDDKHEVSIDTNIIELTYKEYELLKFLIQNKSIVLTRERLMERVWGFDYEGESRTIDMHIKTLRQKLGEYGNRIRTVRNVGYVLE